MDGFVSLIDGEVRCLFFGFRTAKWEQQSQKIFRNLQAKKRISRDIEIIYLPPGMAIPVRGVEFFCFLLVTPPDDDSKATIATLSHAIRERLGFELYERESPEFASAITTVVMEVRQRS